MYTFELQLLYGLVKRPFTTVLCELGFGKRTTMKYLKEEAKLLRYLLRMLYYAIQCSHAYCQSNLGLVCRKGYKLLKEWLPYSLKLNSIGYVWYVVTPIERERLLQLSFAR